MHAKLSSGWKEQQPSSSSIYKIIQLDACMHILI